VAAVWNSERRQTVRAAFSAAGAPHAREALATVERALDEFYKSWTAMSVEACEATQVRGEQAADVLERREDCLTRKLEQAQVLVDVLGAATPPVVDRAPLAVKDVLRVDECAAVAPQRPASIATGAFDPTAVLHIRRLLAQGHCVGTVGDYAKGAEYDKQALDEARRLRHRGLEATAAADLGHFLEALGRYDEAVRVLQDGVLAAEASGNDRVAGFAWKDLSYVLANDLHRPDEAILAAHHAEAYGERPGADTSVAASAANSLGVAYMARADYDLARASFERALSLYQGGSWAGAEDTAVALGNLCDALRGLRRFDEAHARCTRSIALFRTHLGDDNPEVALASDLHGTVFLDEGKPAEALAVFQDALGRVERQLGRDHPQSGIEHQHVGDALMALGRAVEALEHYERSLSIFLAAHPHDPPGAELEALRSALARARRPPGRAP
jgi:tetratricopeptide (TPR) repeat protein